MTYLYNATLRVTGVNPGVGGRHPLKKHRDHFYTGASHATALHREAPTRLPASAVNCLSALCSYHLSQPLQRDSRVLVQPSTETFLSNQSYEASTNQSGSILTNEERAFWTNQSARIWHPRLHKDGPIRDLEQGPFSI